MALSRRDPLAALAAAMHERDEDDDMPRRSRPIPEAQIEELKDICSRYVAGCPFKVGDIVTPRRGYNIKGSGHPHIVIEVPAEPHRPFDVIAPSEAASHPYGARRDMRVVCMTDRGLSYSAFWAESWTFEPYTA